MDSSNKCWYLFDLAVNPDLRIYSRQFKLLAWAPSFPTPVSLSVTDAELLCRVLAGRDIFSNGDSSEDTSTAETDREAIERLLGQRLLLSANLARTSPSRGMNAWLDATTSGKTETRLGARFEISRQTCLQIGVQAFYFYSSILKQYRKIPPDVALQALRLASVPPRNGSEKTVSGHDRPGIENLIALGLLAETPGRSESVSIDTPIQTSKWVHLGSNDIWSRCHPDNRTPIYFVTHSSDHLPLALGMMHANIQSHRNGALLGRYQPLPLVTMSPRETFDVFRRFGPGIWLFSNYMWSLKGNLQFSKSVKRELGPENLTIHGGPSTPKYESANARFMNDNQHVDICVRGEGESTLAEILEVLPGKPHSDDFAHLDSVKGISYRDRSSTPAKLCRTEDRPRALDIDRYPSPYRSGVFDNYGGKVAAAILETNRGCPYGCTFCDWGSATQQKIKRFDLERVRDEIDWIGRHRIRVLWIADANFGAFQRDIEIARHIADTKARYGFPREVVVNYPKNATRRIAEIVRILVDAEICSQGIISIQTTDPATLHAINRSNIKTSKYVELGEIFRSKNLPLSTDLMIGLPGATIESFKNDLQYYFDQDIAVKAYRTQLLPNSPMADPAYAQTYRIETDKDGYLISTSSYGEDDLNEMCGLWTTFDISDGYCLLRYVLRYLQWDKGIPAVEFLHRLMGHALTNPDGVPAISWVLRMFVDEHRVIGGWEPFYNEVASFARREFDIVMDSGFATALRVNELMMPSVGRVFPDKGCLEHDFVSYFNENVSANGSTRKPLVDYPPSSIVIEDPNDLSNIDFDDLEQYDNHQVFFELQATISRIQSSHNFVQKEPAVA